MLNREENLKKINAELEMLSYEELEHVSGGTIYETADDSRFLNVLLQGTKFRQCDRYGATKILFSHDACVDVYNAWDSLGIRMISDQLFGNKYILNKKEISRAEA